MVSGGTMDVAWCAVKQKKRGLCEGSASIVLTANSKLGDRMRIICTIDVYERLTLRYAFLATRPQVYRPGSERIPLLLNLPSLSPTVPKRWGQHRLVIPLKGTDRGKAGCSSTGRWHIICYTRCKRSMETKKPDQRDMRRVHGHTHRRHRPGVASASASRPYARPHQRSSSEGVPIVFHGTLLMRSQTQRRDRT